MDAFDRVNILLVDDQPGKLLSYKTILSPLGENLITATSGREALEQLLRTDVTVVITDVSMPDLDGFELAEIIRQHPRYEKTAILFVSAVHLTDLDRLKGYESGAVDYVSVPIVPELLRAKVRVFIELYRKTRELERLNAELEKRVAERTAELEASMEMQVEMGERLRKADRRKNEFLALLSHELRNPLAPISHAVHIMRLKGSLDADLFWCRDVIERQANQLTRLVDDLLDISRITQGKFKLRLQPLDLATVLSGAVETSQPLIDAQRHELVVTNPELPVWVDGDSARLTQLIANLLNNAAKYQTVGGRIDLSLEEEGGMAVLRVKDQGIGIAPERLGQIFELFSQGEPVTERTQAGLGLGLSLVKSLTEMHGGSVEASSEGLGRGSELTVRLPILRGEDLARRRATQESQNAEAVWSCRVLVVDDHVDSAETLAVLLRANGYEVLAASDGLQAVEMAIAHRPEVVLLDIGLPGINGFEVCRRMRAAGLNDAHIVALTGFGQKSDRERSQEAGFDAHMIKPIALAELLKLLSTRWRTPAANGS